MHCPPVTTAVIRRPDSKYQLGFCVENGVVSARGDGSGARLGSAEGFHCPSAMVLAVSAWTSAQLQCSLCLPGLRFHRALLCHSKKLFIALLQHWRLDPSPWCSLAVCFWSGGFFLTFLA